MGYSAIDQIAQFGLSSLKVIYYSEQLFRVGIHPFEPLILSRTKICFWLGFSVFHHPAKI
ncbi:hypothetical protein KPLM21_1400002 [Klebsiella pneumoniae]|nr:hypothetical protein KPLM21_1400002 [Klebsiella pneumoniae]